MPTFPPERPPTWNLHPERRNQLYGALMWVAIIVLSCAAIALAVKITEIR